MVCRATRLEGELSLRPLPPTRATQQVATRTLLSDTFSLVISLRRMPSSQGHATSSRPADRREASGEGYGAARPLSASVFQLTPLSRFANYP